MATAFEEERRLRLEAEAELQQLRQQLPGSCPPSALAASPGHPVPRGVNIGRGQQRSGPAPVALEEHSLYCGSPVTGLVDRTAGVKVQNSGDGAWVATAAVVAAGVGMTTAGATMASPSDAGGSGGVFAALSSPVRKLDLPWQATPLPPSIPDAVPSLAPPLAALDGSPNAIHGAPAADSLLDLEPLPPWHNATNLRGAGSNGGALPQNRSPGGQTVSAGGNAPIQQQKQQGNSWVRSLSTPPHTSTALKRGSAGSGAALASSPPLPHPRSSGGGGVVFVIGGSSTAPPQQRPEGAWKTPPPPIAQKSTGLSLRQSSAAGGSGGGGQAKSLLLSANDASEQPITGAAILSCLEAAGTKGMSGRALAERFDCIAPQPRQGGGGGGAAATAGMSMGGRSMVLNEGRARKLTACLGTLISDLDIFRRGGSSSVTDCIDLTDAATVFVVL